MIRKLYYYIAREFDNDFSISEGEVDVKREDDYSLFLKKNTLPEECFYEKNIVSKPSIGFVRSPRNDGVYIVFDLTAGEAYRDILDWFYLQQAKYTKGMIALENTLTFKRMNIKGD